jgi:glycogen debranching enzyme
MPQTTALERTCVLHTPNELINQGFRFAKDNIARCMRYYTLGWGMSNWPNQYAIVVGRDTGWMSIGADFVAPWFAPAALTAFRDRQKSNGQILEYIDMESGRSEDNGLNIADNTPFYIWAVWHHWKQYQESSFLADFQASVRAAADHLMSEIGPNGLLVGIPDGVETRGITSWRNIIPGAVMAGESTEINALSGRALNLAAEILGEDRYAAAGKMIFAALNRQLWTGTSYLLNRQNGIENAQITGDMLFPIFTGAASLDQARLVFNRLEQDDFWTPRGMRTIPNSDPAYDPAKAFGLLGGSWPNLTLWYAAAVAPLNPNRALAALEMVARPVVEQQPPEMNVNYTEFAEWFHGDTGINGGMLLSPWVAPTFLWAILEGLLGLTWNDGRPEFHPHWPDRWDKISIENMPCAEGMVNSVLKR